MSWGSSRKKLPKRPSFAILNPKGGPGDGAKFEQGSEF
jgi:hypothetical protein